MARPFYDHLVELTAYSSMDKDIEAWEGEGGALGGPLDVRAQQPLYKRLTNTHTG